MTVERSFDGVRFYADEREPDLWRYWPERLSPERGPDGRPTVSLFVMGAAASLQLGARWGVEEEALDALRAHVAGGRPARFAPAPAQVGDAVLEIGDGSGGFRELARASTSGFPPYQVVFSVVLGPEDKGRAANAIAGREGWLRVRYDASLQRPSGAEGAITGWLPARGALDPRARVKAAVDGGALTVDVTGRRALRDQVKALLLDEAAAAAAAAPGQTHLDVSAAIGSVTRAQIEVTADVAEWLPQDAPERHVRNFENST